MSGNEGEWPAYLATFFAQQGVAGMASVAQPQALEHGSARWSSANVHELLTFHVAEQLHALSIRDVVEVAKLPVLTWVPRLQPGVMGVISLRGNLVPVVDVAHFFEPVPQAETAGKSARRLPTHLVVLGNEAAPLGLAVGPIVGVNRLPSEAVVARRPLAGDKDAFGPSCIGGFATTAHGATVVVFAAEALQRRFATL